MAIDALSSLKGLIKKTRQNLLKTGAGQNQTVRVQDIYPLENKVNEVLTQVNTNTSGLTTSGYSYKEVSVSAVNWLAIGTTPKELLATAGAGNYWDYYYVIEYTDGATAYTTAEAYLFVGDLTSYAGTVHDTSSSIKTKDDFILSGSSTAHISGVVSGDSFTYARRPNLNVVLTTYGAGDPTLGDGTAIVKVWYKLKTMGTEL